MRTGWLGVEWGQRIFWPLAGTAAATGCFWLARSSLDSGQASLLYLPVVIACAIRFGFGAGVLGALLSFFCWDFFFLPPFHRLTVDNPRDWLSLFIFLVAALTTAHLASQARLQAQAAKVREREAVTLYQASEAISSEIDAAHLLPALAEQIVRICRASRCVIWRGTSEESYSLAVAVGEPLSSHDDAQRERAASTPLRVKERLVGALYVGPRRDGQPFSPQDQRLMLALANHAAVVIARQTLAEEAAQATALREADALKDALLSMVTHELRAPLAAIKAASSGLRQRESVWPEEARAEALQTIDVEADRLTGLVSNLLDLSRLEAGAWKPSKDWCDLSEIAGTALDRLGDSDAARVQIASPADLPLIRADYVQIALVLTNLLENAAKYSPVLAPIRLSFCAAPGGVQAEVRDFGEGVMSGEEDVIFERFRRSARHVDSAIHGTGLGLALCRAVLEAHGGRIWAESAPAEEDRGALFSFFLPTG